MKRLFFRCLKATLLMGIVGFAGSVQADINIVTNGNFGTGDFTGWTLSGDGGLETSGFDSYVTTDGLGNYVAALGTTNTDGLLTQSLATTQGMQYTVSFLLTSDGATPNSFSASLGGTSLIDPTQIAGPSSSYTSYSYIYNATSASPSLLSFDFLDNPGFEYLTNVSVVANSAAVPEPTSVIGLGLGSLMVAGYCWLKRHRSPGMILVRA